MFKDADPFTSFSVNDLDAAQAFYGEKLGLDVTKDTAMSILDLKLKTGGRVMIYPKEDHEPAKYTILNFRVDDIEAAVGELEQAGIELEQYDMPGLKTDEHGIAAGTGGPKMAWFKDPAGNILGVLEDDRPR